jgi:protein disulfide-isomerase
MRTAGIIGGIFAAIALLWGCSQPAAASADGIWVTDFDAALKQAAEQNKYVLVDFSGSDWCGWCIKLDKEVFSQSEFIDYAEENLICVLLDFPRTKPQSDEQKAANRALAERYGIEGFPTVLILNPEGKVVERTGYQPGGPGPYVEMIKGAIGK